VPPLVAGGFFYLRKSSMMWCVARYRTKLIERQEIAEGTMAFRFEKPKGFEFTAGQHVDIDLLNPTKTDEKGNGRDLSIASAPEEDFIMVATRMTGSAFKENLREMPLGTEVMLKGPGGDFMLHQDAKLPAVFLIGGIGITPIRSIVLDATERKLSHKLYLFYSNRTPEATAFLNDVTGAQRRNPNFTLVGTMTNMEDSKEDWEGEREVITATMVKKYIPSPEGAVFYLAGPEGMVQAMRDLVLGIGVSDLQIRSEEFPGY
jgi:ferredoxin-NADP reductase